MPRSWQYPRWRRILVQAILCLVLAGAVAVAALVSRQRIQSQQINLSRQITLGTLTLQLPAKWNIIAASPDVGLIAREPRDSDQQRTLAIRLQPVNSNISAIDFLYRNGVGQQPIDVNDPVAQSVDPIQIAGSPGVLKKFLHSDPNNPQSEEITRQDLIAAAVLPSHQAIIIQLSCPPEADEENTTLIRQIAAAITLNK